MVRVARLPTLSLRWAQLRAASAKPRGQRWVAVAEVVAVAGLVATPTGYPQGWPMEVLLVTLGLGSAAARLRRAHGMSRGMAGEGA